MKEVGVQLSLALDMHEGASCTVHFAAPILKEPHAGKEG